MGNFNFSPDKSGLAPPVEVSEPQETAQMNEDKREETQGQDREENEQERFGSLIAPVFCSTETCLSQEQFTLSQAQSFVCKLRGVSDSQRQRGCLEDNMESALLSRALQTVQQLDEGVKRQEEVYDPRQMMTYLYCVMTVFPSSVQLRPGQMFQFSQNGQRIYDTFDTIQYYCDLKTMCENCAGMENYVKHQRVLLDLALWLQAERPIVAHLIISGITNHVSGTRNYLQPSDPIFQKLEQILHAASIQTSLSLVQQSDDGTQQSSGRRRRRSRSRRRQGWRHPRSAFQPNQADYLQSSARQSDRGRRAVRYSRSPSPCFSDVSTMSGATGTTEYTEISEVTASSLLEELNMIDLDSDDTDDEEEEDEESLCMDDFYTDYRETTDTRGMEAWTQEEDESRNWFEKSVDQAENGGMDEDCDVQLSDRLIDDLTKRGRAGKFYDHLITDPEHLRRLLTREPQRYKRCRLRIESSHRSVAMVLDKDSEMSEIIISGRSKCGQTYNDDEVVVRVVGISGQSPYHVNSVKTSAGEDRSTEGVTYGRVVGLLKRENFADVEKPQFFCTLDDMESHLMKPLCKTVPKIHVMNDRVMKMFPSLKKFRVEIKEVGLDGNIHFKRFFDIRPGKREQYIFKVVLLVWNRGNIYPLGAVLDAFVGGRDYSSGLGILSMKEKVPRFYPQDVVAEMQNVPQEAVRMSTGRTILTDRRTFTIDPPGSKDLDDALSVWKEGDITVVGVHIADVAAVVKAGTAVDDEARKRATSYYPLLRGPRHMLPEPISTDVCSLLPNKERLAISVFFKFNDEGEQIGDPTVHKTLIKSEKQMTYRKVQDIIQGLSVTDVNSALQSDVLTLHKLATGLRTMRLKQSLLFVPFEDPRLLELEDLKDNLEAHALVEEFMILTNAHIAQRLRPKFPDQMILRCQKAPTYEQLAEWREKEGDAANLVMRLQGKNVTPETKIFFDNASSQQQEIIIKADLWEVLCRHIRNGEIDKARRLAFTDDLHPLQCLANNHWMELMETAKYECSYGLNKLDHIHFGLDLDFYTHFTSPIRRYSDLHVHRLLHADLDGDTPSCTPDDVTALCRCINSATKRQRAFGTGCLSLKIADSLLRQPLVFRAYVDQIDSEQLTLRVPSLRAVPDRKQELPFSILGVSSQPQLSTVEKQNKATVAVKWSTRIYNKCMACPPDFVRIRKAMDRIANRLPSSPLVLNINPHFLSISLEHSKWVGILKNLTELNCGRWAVAPLPAQSRGLEVNYMTSEKGDGTVSLRPCHFKMDFTQGQVLKVQMSAEPRRGVLQPRVDLLHTALNASVCTQHVGEPVLTLSRPASRSTRGKSFKSYKDYVCAWMPLLEMEAAYEAGGSDEGLVVENVDMSFKVQSRPGCSRSVYTASFSLDAKFCFERGIEFGGKSPDGTKGDEPKGNGAFPLDYLCIRHYTECPESVISRVEKSSIPEAAVDKHYTWLGHAIIVDVRSEDRIERKGVIRGSDIHVMCELSPSCPPPLQSLLQYPRKLTVELLPKSAVERRAQESLLVLKRRSDKLKLAKAIAYGSSLPRLDINHLAKGKNDKYHEVLLKVPDTETGRLKRLLPGNNPMQYNAIKAALTNSLSLIQGPPGTGKTCTGVKLVYLFCKINRQLEAEGKGKKTVLFCGPSNKSVDLVAKYLKNRLREHCPKMIRMYGSAIESKDYPVPRSSVGSTRSTRDLQSDRELEDVTLHHVIRQEGKPHALELAKFKKLFEECRAKPDTIQLDNEIIKKYRRLLYIASVEELKNYEVVLTTCAVGGNRKLVKGTKGTVFQVIIDECAMSPEPHSLIPIVATKAQQVVLIGDHKQLRPIIPCQAAADLGLDQSLFERLYQRYEHEGNAVLLNTQYRMHPQICQFPSEEFYNGCLKTVFKYREDERPLRFWPRRHGQEVPHILVNVRGEEETLTVSTNEGNEKSKSNALEADKVMEILSHLKAHRVELQYVKVLTQYNAQRHLLEERMKQLAEERAMHFVRTDMVKCNVSTVVSSQGGEWDYVILSTVRSLPSYKIESNPTYGWCRQNLGFITDRNQVNVALTRAKKGLIIVGNMELLRCDEVWRNLVDRYAAMGCVYEAKQFPPP